jgi:ParB/RepB/Spo0J family partition protein
MSKNSPTASATHAAMPDAQAYPNDKIHDNPWQPRQAMDPAGIQELAEDFKRNNMLQLPEGRPHPTIRGAVQLSLGHRRRKAWFIAFPDQPMPVVVKPLTDLEMYQHALAENGGESGGLRQALNVIEIAQAIERGIKEFGLTQLQAGAPLGYKTQGAVGNVVGLLELPASMQQGVADGRIPQRVARALKPLARIAPKDAERLASQVEKAKPAQRDTVLSTELSRLLHHKGQRLDLAPFKTNWPPKPIALNGDRPEGAPEVLPDCDGCPFHLIHDRTSYCAERVCYDLKVKHFLKRELQSAVDRLGIPGATLTEEKSTEIVCDGYSDQSSLRRLLQAAKNMPELGLRLQITDDNNWYLRDQLGNGYLRLTSLNPDTVKKYLSAGAKAVAKPGTTNAKASERQAAREREKRREGRASRLRAIQDVIWLVKNTTPIIASQLAISGPVLRYVVAELADWEYGQAMEFYGLKDFADDLEAQIKKAAGKEQEALLRQRLALSEIYRHVFGYSLAPKLKDDFAGVWEKVRGDLQALATDGLKSKVHLYVPPSFHPGLGVTLPSGWDEPPVHHTSYNCWRCGRFASNTYLTKANFAEGWQIKTQGQQTLSVTCPDCVNKSSASAKAGKGKKK